MEALSELFLLHVAKVKKIPTPTAAKLIDKCLSMISAEENVGYNTNTVRTHTNELPDIPDVIAAP